MKMHLFIYLIFCIILGFSLKPVEAKELNIITTLPSLASITTSIGGEKVKVSSITLGAQDAHYIEAKPSYMFKLNKADLLIYSGMELEIGWLPLLIQGARNEKVTVGSAGNLNASSALSAQEILEKPRGEVDRSMGDVHPTGNPHYLLNPHNAVGIAEIIAERLIQLAPENKEYFRQNLDRFKILLNEKINQFENQAAYLQGKEIVCYHVHWSYLLYWLKLRPVGYIESRPGIPPTPKHKKAIIDLMNERDIKAVIISSWKEPTKAQEVADAVNAQLVILPGEVNALDGTDDYINWLSYMVTQLTEALPADSPEVQSNSQQRHQERKRGEQ